MGQAPSSLLIQPTLGKAPPPTTFSPVVEEKELIPTFPPSSEPITPPPLAAQAAPVPPSTQPDDVYYPPERIPLGIYLLDAIFNGTTGTLSIDLKRPQPPRFGTRSLLTYNHHESQQQQQYQQQRGAGRRRRPRQYIPPEAQDQRRQFIDYSSLPNFAFNSTGARVKALRHIQFGSKCTYTKYGHTITAPQFDLGAGGEFRFDTAEFHPLLRLKIRDLASLQLLPQPALKIQKRLQLGTSGLGVRMSYECPLESIHQFFKPPARLLLTVDNMTETGVRLTQSGVEVNGNQWVFGDVVRLRAAGIVRFPSSVPVDEDEPLLQFDAQRLGIKVKW